MIWHHALQARAECSQAGSRRRSWRLCLPAVSAGAYGRRVRISPLSRDPMASASQPTEGLTAGLRGSRCCFSPRTTGTTRPQQVATTRCRRTHVVRERSSRCLRARHRQRTLAVGVQRNVVDWVEAAGWKVDVRSVGGMPGRHRNHRPVRALRGLRPVDGVSTRKLRATRPRGRCQTRALRARRGWSPSGAVAA